MSSLLDKIDAADGLVLASPVNYSTVTALMKRFVERLIVYGYWPWRKGVPADRIKKKAKRAVVLTSSACPAILARGSMPNALSVLRMAAGCAGAKVVADLYYGMVAMEKDQRLTGRQLRQARKAGEKLARDR